MANDVKYNSNNVTIFGPFSFLSLISRAASFNRISIGVAVLKFCIRSKESRCILDLACLASFPVLPEPCFQFLKPELVNASSEQPTAKKLSNLAL